MQKVKLGDICQPKQWTTIPMSGLSNNGYTVYGANGKIGFYKEFNHINPTIIITCRGATCGSIHITEPKSYINGNAMCLDNLSNEVLLKYLYYQLLNFDFKQVISGSAQPQITREGLNKMWINIYSEKEQKAIAERLDKISELIEKRKEQIKKLDFLIKSRFIEMFGDITINDKKWDVVSFLKAADFDCKMINDFQEYMAYPHIGIDSIEKDTGNLIGYRTILEDNVISGKYLFSSQHILYSKIRPNLNKVALPNFNGLCSADAYPILPKKDVCNRWYLAFVLRSKYFLDYILQFSSRTNLPKVNKKEIAGFSFPLPPLELQNKFAVFVEKIDKVKQTIKTHLEKLETLKKSLMQQYFG